MSDTNNFCRHAIDLSESDCMNCERDDKEFMLMFGRGYSEHEIGMARSGFDTAMRYRDREIKENGDWPEF